MILQNDQILLPVFKRVRITFANHNLSSSDNFTGLLRLVSIKISVELAKLRVRGSSLSVLECANTVIYAILEPAASRRAILVSSSVISLSSIFIKDRKRPIHLRRKLSTYIENKQTLNSVTKVIVWRANSVTSAKCITIPFIPFDRRHLNISTFCFLEYFRKSNLILKLIFINLYTRVIRDQYHLDGFIHRLKKNISKKVFSTRK